MTDNTELDQQIDDIHAVIKQAQTRIEQREVIDLKGLNLKVQDMCRDVLALPAEQAKEYKTTMMDIIGNLNTLEQSLKTFNGEMTKLKENLE